MDEQAQKPGPDQQEFAWIRAFLDGDRGAFDNLVLRHKDRIFNLCFRFLGDREEADEHAQEVFVKVYRSLKSFRFDSSFSTWLYSITVNTCKNRLRSKDYRYRKRMVGIDSNEDPERGERLVTLKDPNPSPFDRLAEKERETLLQRALDELPEDSKTIVVLRDIEGLTYEEIADITGYNLGTVKSRLARSRAQLRDKLRGMF